MTSSRTPLASFRLGLETLDRHQLAPVQRGEFIGRMGEDLDRLEYTVAQVIAAARAEETARSRSSRQVVEIQPLLSEHIDELCERHALGEDAVLLDWTRSQRVRGDAAELHRPLEALKKAHTRTFGRLQMMMEKFHFEIRFVPGKDNTVADYLSRHGHTDRAQALNINQGLGAVAMNCSTERLQIHAGSPKSRIRSGHRSPPPRAATVRRRNACTDTAKPSLPADLYISQADRYLAVIETNPGKGRLQ